MAARKLIYFQKRAAKLGPSYLSCNERQSACTRSKAKPRLGCPDCEFTIQYKTFIKELESELAKIPKSTRRGHRKWPAKYLLSTASEIAYLANSVKGIGRKWSVVTALLVSIYRDEMSKMKAIENYKLAQAADSASIGADDDKDEGDFD